MLPRKLLFSALAIAANTPCQIYPLDVFLPGVDVTDSISSRSIHSNEQVGGWDAFVREKDHEGRPLRLDERLWSTVTADPDSIVFWADWNQALPQPGPGMFAAASRQIMALFKAGQETHRDTITAHWNAQERVLIHTKSEPEKGCRWQDSCRFDPQGRLIFQYTCTTRRIDSAGGTIVRPDGYVYRAWFEKESDTLPRKITRTSGLASESWIDSLQTVGEANRPDSIRGTENLVLVRDPAGRILSATPTASTSYESHFYLYDPWGRIVQSISTFASSSDTTSYSYSWSSPVGVRHQAELKPGIRRVAQGIQIDLPAPDRIRAESISLHGKRLSLLADRDLPAGRSLLPFSVKAGDIVRIVSKNGTTSFVIPVL